MSLGRHNFPKRTILFLPKDKIVLKLEMFIDVNKDWTKKFLHIYCIVFSVIMDKVVHKKRLSAITDKLKLCSLIDYFSVAAQLWTRLSLTTHNFNL